MLKDFAKFLKEFNIVSLAVGFVMGTASTSLVNSLVKDVFMPIVTPLMGAESWREALWHIGPVTVAIGSFIAELFFVFVFTDENIDRNALLYIKNVFVLASIWCLLFFL